MSNIRIHVRNNVKNQVRQKTTPIRGADCCFHCKKRGILYGHFSDAVECNQHHNEHGSIITVHHVDICDKFERRE